VPSAIDTQLQRASVVLAEELHYGRAAKRLHVAISTLSKQVARLENKLGITLFVRDSKHVELTDAGKAYIEEIRGSLLQAERAVNAARAANAKKEHMISIGHTPYVESKLVRTLLSVRLMNHPKIQIRLHSDFAPDLIRGVTERELDLALLSCPPNSGVLKYTEVHRSPLYVMLPEYHHASGLDKVFLSDLVNDDWILFNRRIDSYLYDATLQQAVASGIVAKPMHHIVTLEEGVHLVREDAGVALMAQSAGLTDQRLGVVVRPIADKTLQLTTHLAVRVNEPSPLIREFAHEFLRQWCENGRERDKTP
jgi:LysR family transcriptional regulator, benzoate and cis,cis-muconate-responsive activator of ben and cat genes